MSYIEGEKVYLREVRESDINDNYYAWMNDYDTNRYMETRFLPQGRNLLQSYVKEHTGKMDEPWFAICEKEGNRHVGNIKIGPINFYHRRADISYFIGEKNCRGKGYATEAIKLVTQIAFNRLGLYKLSAGAYASNKASHRVLEINGFRREGILKEHVFSEGGREDCYIFGLTVEDYLR